MTDSTRVPTLVLGGTGYVAGELLRLIAGHPRLRLAGILSDSKPGERVAAAFPHLAVAYPHTTYLSLDETESLIASTEDLAVLAAAPHGVSAALLDRLLIVALDCVSSIFLRTIASRTPRHTNPYTSTRTAHRPVFRTSLARSQSICRR